MLPVKLVRARLMVTVVDWPALMVRLAGWALSRTLLAATTLIGTVSDCTVGPLTVVALMVAEVVPLPAPALALSVMVTLLPVVPLGANVAVTPEGRPVADR